MCRYVCGITSSASLKVDSRKAVTAAHGIDRVIAAMDRHMGDANVQWRGCSALWNMTFTPESKAQVVSCGGAERVRRAKAAHPTDANVQDKANKVLDALGLAA